MIPLPNIPLRDDECSVIAEDVKYALGGQCDIVTVVMVDTETGRPVPFYLKEKHPTYDMYDYHTICLVRDGYDNIIIDYGNPEEQFHIVSFMNYLKRHNQNYIPPTVRVVMFLGHYDDNYLRNPQAYISTKQCVCEL